MKTVDFEQDRLTHQLMEGTTERPSSSMNARIMAILMKEKRKVYVYTVRFWLTPGPCFFVIRRPSQLWGSPMGERDLDDRSACSCPTLSGADYAMLRPCLLCLLCSVG